MAHRSSEAGARSADAVDLDRDDPINLTRDWSYVMLQLSCGGSVRKVTSGCKTGGIQLLVIWTAIPTKYSVCMCFFWFCFCWHIMLLHQASERPNTTPRLGSRRKLHMTELKTKIGEPTPSKHVIMQSPAANKAGRLQSAEFYLSVMQSVVASASCPGHSKIALCNSGMARTLTWDFKKPPAAIMAQLFAWQHCGLKLWLVFARRSREQIADL